MNNNDGGPAFPHVYIDDGQPATIAAGMTLRDYFSAKAMATMLSDESWHGHTIGAAATAYEMADAMIAERAK